jgi:hypothetical protein
MLILTRVNAICIAWTAIMVPFVLFVSLLIETTVLFRFGFFKVHSFQKWGVELVKQGEILI